ncbi:hypothetical protein [Mesorhizobium sp. URHB0026]
MNQVVHVQFLETALAYFNLSQTQRRLAHEVRREAFDWEARGHYQNFASCMLEGRRLWRDSIWHLQRARMNSERAKVRVDQVGAS